MIERYVSPEEWQRLRIGLTAVIGAILIFGLFALIVVPGLRNANRPPTQTPVETVAGSSGWLDPTEYPPMRGYEIPPLDPKTVMEPTPEMLGRGKALYGQYCVPCHADDGLGKGPASASLKPPPRNFAQSGGWKNGPGRPSIFKTLAQGVPGSAMVAYDMLTKQDRMALVHYVRSFARFEQPVERAEALAALAKDLAAPGERVPSRIPVSAAENKLVAEYRGPLPLALDDESSAALRMAIADGTRVARVLAQHPEWQQSPEILASLALADLPENGFRPAAGALTSAQWQALFAELRAATAPAAETELRSATGGRR